MVVVAVLAEALAVAVAVVEAFMAIDIGSAGMLLAAAMLALDSCLARISRAGEAAAWPASRALARVNDERRIMSEIEIERL